MSVYITGVVVMKMLIFIILLYKINLVELILFYLFVMFSYNLDVIGVIFYFILFLHFIVYYVLFSDVMGNYYVTP